MKFPTYGKISQMFQTTNQLMTPSFGPRKTSEDPKTCFWPMIFDDLVGTKPHPTTGEVGQLRLLAKPCFQTLGIEHGSPKKSMARYHWVSSVELWEATKKTCHDPILPSSAGQVSPIFSPSFQTSSICQSH